MSRALEHIGFAGVYLIDPALVVRVATGPGQSVDFGAECCTEQELCDFVQFRAALMLKCGRFDQQLLDVRVEATWKNYRWELAYDEHTFNFEIVKPHEQEKEKGSEGLP